MFTSADGTYRKNGPWERSRHGLWRVVESHQVPAQYVGEYDSYLSTRTTAASDRVSAEREAVRRRNAEASHLEALEIQFIVDSYVTGASPRLFRHGCEVVDSGTFTAICASTFGWRGRAATWYRRVDQALLDAGLRVRKFAPRASIHSRDGVANVPKTLEDVEEF